MDLEERLAQLEEAMKKTEQNFYAQMNYMAGQKALLQEMIQAAEAPPEAAPTA